MMKKIMFVCTGNTCRSPMAEAILKAMLKEKGVTGIKVSSSGISPVLGQQVMPNANAALNALGFKTVKRGAMRLTKEDIETYDLIICMTESHKRCIGDRANITTVAAITGLHDVNDPYGDSLDTYIKTAEYLKYACGDILSIITKESKPPKPPKQAKEKRVKLKMRPEDKSRGIEEGKDK